jgi:hypothetical protein
LKFRNIRIGDGNGRVQRKYNSGYQPHLRFIHASSPAVLLFETKAILLKAGKYVKKKWMALAIYEILVKYRSEKDNGGKVPPYIPISA